MRFEPEVEDFISNYMKDGYTLNVPAGQSPLGTIKGDIEPQNENVRYMDMRSLPFANCVFDVSLSDPPWHLNLFQRFRPFYELVRVTKVGGRIIYVATWIPESKAVELEKLMVRQSAKFANASIVSVFKKTTDEYDGENGQRLRNLESNRED